MGKLVDEQGVLLANEQVGPNLYVMEIAVPLIASTVEPGQFVHLKVPGLGCHILRRPFSVYNRNQKRQSIEVLYQSVGAGTEHMCSLETGCSLELIGPIGTGWSVPEYTKTALLVGGGVGAAPLFLLAQQLIEQGVHVKTVLGAQTKGALVTHDRYLELLQENVSCSTDDGTFGHAGFCTPLVQQHLDVTDFDYLACCGPEPLMRLVAGLAKQSGVYCQVSLERRMACGIGACLSCVVDTDDGKKRACVDGPVFDAVKVGW